MESFGIDRIDMATGYLVCRDDSEMPYASVDTGDSYTSRYGKSFEIETNDEVVLVRRSIK